MKVAGQLTKVILREAIAGDVEMPKTGKARKQPVEIMQFRVRVHGDVQLDEMRVLMRRRLARVRCVRHSCDDRDFQPT